MLYPAFLAALAVAQPVVPPLPLADAKPKWALEYAPNACILSHPRAGGAGGFRIETRPFEQDHKLSLMLSKVGKGSFFGAGRLSVSDPRPKYPFFMKVEETKKEQDRLVTGSISEVQLAALATQTALGVTIPGKLNERVSVAGLAKALLALDRCEEDLAQRWGTPRAWAADPKPLNGPMGIIRDDDYPDSLVRANVEGSVRLMLQIDSSGQIQRCRALESIGPVIFAEVVCSVLKKRLKFTPAKDAAGTSVPSYFVVPEMRFVLAN